MEDPKFTTEEVRYLRDKIINKLMTNFKECCPLLKFEHELKEFFKQELEKAEGE